MTYYLEMTLLNQSIVAAGFLALSFMSTHAYADAATEGVRISTQIANECLGAFKSDAQSNSGSALDVSGYVSWFFRYMPVCLENNRRHREYVRALTSW